MKLRTKATPQRSKRSLETALRKKAVEMLGSEMLTVAVDPADYEATAKAKAVYVDGKFYRVVGPSRDRRTILVEPE